MRGRGLLGLVAGLLMAAAPLAAPLTTPDGGTRVVVRADSSGFDVQGREGDQWRTRRGVTLRGLVADPVLSPDGRRIAFTNLRGGSATGAWGPHPASWAFIGVHDLASGETHWLEPWFARDAAPRWDDVGHVSFTRRIDGQPDRQVRVAVDAPRPTVDPLLTTLLSVPLTYQPTASGDGRACAWVTRAGRERAVWFARPGAAAVALARFPDDDGQELGELAVNRDGSLVAFVRGGARNRDGEAANPRHLPTAPVPTIWLVRTGQAASQAAGPAVPLAAGSAPLFTPDGKALVFVTPRGVLRHDLASGTTGALLAGPAQTLRFASDGRLSFERAGSLFVLDPATGDQWRVARPEGARDSDAAWAPDGRTLVFRREVGKAATLEAGYTGPFEAKTPWAIMAVDTASRTVRQLWQAEAGRGSAWYGADPDPTKTGRDAPGLIWLASGDIAFISEKDGWRHLWAVPLAGGPARLLTPGDGEVEAAEATRDGRAIVYAHNIGDPDRRQLAMVDAAGRVTPLTRGPASHWGATPLADGGLALIAADAAGPPRLLVRDAAGTVTAAGGPAAPAGWPGARFVTPVPVSFPASDGATAYGQLFEPAKPTGCGLVFVHGGIRRQMLLGWHYMDAHAYLYGLNQYFAMQGCRVLSVEYRSSIMRGEAFRNAPGWGAGGASEVMDVIAGGRWLRARGATRIGIHGLSWGGYLTAQALARESGLFVAGFDMAGVHEFPGDAMKDSPMGRIAGWTSPVLLAAGDDDRNVDFGQTVRLASALLAKGVAVEGRAYVGETHDLYLTLDDLTDAYGRGARFMLDRVGGPVAP